MTVLAVEDVHWADDATLDLLRHLARRIGDRHGLLVLTLRPGDLEPGHPLRTLLGELAGARRLRARRCRRRRWPSWPATRTGRPRCTR